VFIFRRLKIKHESHEFTLDPGTVANTKSAQKSGAGLWPSTKQLLLKILLNVLPNNEGDQTIRPTTMLVVSSPNSSPGPTQSNKLQHSTAFQGQRARPDRS
jgi:hypothetical protein